MFGLDVYAVTSKFHADLPNGIMKSTLDGMLAMSDVVTLHCPLTADTQHLINKETLSKMKRGAILINTGRGPLVDEQAVADALADGRLSAYCADVLSTEPARADNPLLKCPNAYLTPHVAWATFEARTRLAKIAEENLKAFIEGDPINVVN